MMMAGSSRGGRAVVAFLVIHLHITLATGRPDRPACRTWAADGLCDVDPAFMATACPATCDKAACDKAAGREVAGDDDSNVKARRAALQRMKEAELLKSSAARRNQEEDEKKHSPWLHDPVVKSRREVKATTCGNR